MPRLARFALLLAGTVAFIWASDGDLETRNRSATAAYERRNALEVQADGHANIPAPPAGAKITIATSSTADTATTIYSTAEVDRVPAKGGISMEAFAAQ